MLKMVEESSIHPAPGGPECLEEIVEVTQVFRTTRKHSISLSNIRSLIVSNHDQH